MNQHISFLYSTIVKGKAPKEVTDAIKDLKDLSAFHTSVSVARGIAFQHLADSLFVQLANFILLRRDSYLEYVKPGLKPDTWNKLRNAPLFTYSLFPDDVLAVAEQDILKHESARSASGPGSGTFQHSKKHQFRRTTSNLASHLKINNHGVGSQAEAGEKVVVEVALVPLIFQRLAVVQSSMNDNHCSVSSSVQLRLSCGVLNQVPTRDKMDCQETVNCHVVTPAVIVNGQLQKKNVRPSQLKVEIKSVKGVLCVNQCLSAPIVRNALHVVKDPPVGGRLQRFWQVWLSLGSNPRVVSILKEGYSLPFKVRHTPPPPCQGHRSLRRSGQKQKPKRLLTGPDPKTGGRKGVGHFISGFLQPVISGSKAQQQMETHTRPKSTELVPSISLLQDGNSRDHQALPLTRGVGHLAGFQRRLFSYPDQSKVAEVPKVPSQQPILPIHLPSFRPVDGSIGVHQGRQGGQAKGTSSGYPNPPVPR